KGLVGVLRDEGNDYVKRALNPGEIEEPSIRVPQGFYDWNNNLRKAYKQVKILSRSPDLSDSEQITKKRIMKAVESDDKLKELYRNIMRIYSGMTNTLKSGEGLFPSAKIPDQEFFKELSDETQSDIPGGLGRALVQAIKEGRINFTPNEGSGLYTRQMHEITPLVLRNAEEYAKYLLGERYMKQLDDEFISQWAGTRHTHVGHSDFDDVLIGCSTIEQSPIIITPEITVEPFSTSYSRMRESLLFLEKLLTHEMPEVLEKHRVMNDESSGSKVIGEELTEMQLLLKGLEMISKESLHMTYDYQNKDEEAIRKAKRWIEEAGNDPDMNRNMATFVPIIRTTDGEGQIAYINAGFRDVEVEISYEQKPHVKTGKNQEDKAEEDSWFAGSWREIEFSTETLRFPVLVHKEVRMPHKKIINDRELREIIDENTQDKGIITTQELEEIVRTLEK
ncbi:hypothetical protein COU61_04090, partial [Candidatus Pacearchaeota archaeon CG10_big_fil_rev_8_21_14_0_10_35_13]